MARALPCTTCAVVVRCAGASHTFAERKGCRMGGSGGGREGEWKWECTLAGRRGVLARRIRWFLLCVCGEEGGG